MKPERFGFELWTGVVWLVVGLVAFVLPQMIPVRPAPMAVALGEIVLAAPMALWLALLTARSLADGQWVLAGRPPLRYASAPVTSFAFASVSVLISAVMLAGFVRGVLSLVLVL